MIYFTIYTGTVPPQLLQETVHGLHFIIFLLFDERSALLLKNLVDAKPGFDSDFLLYRGYTWALLENFEYHYCGNRVAKLHHLVTHLSSSHLIGQRVQRHASDRNVLFVAILSLVLCALFGSLNIVIGGFQAWAQY